MYIERSKRRPTQIPSKRRKAQGRRLCGFRGPGQGGQIEANMKRREKNLFEGLANHSEQGNADELKRPCQEEQTLHSEELGGDEWFIPSVRGAGGKRCGDVNRGSDSCEEVLQWCDGRSGEGGGTSKKHRKENTKRRNRNGWRDSVIGRDWGIWRGKVGCQRTLNLWEWQNERQGIAEDRVSQNSGGRSVARQRHRSKRISTPGTQGAGSPPLKKAGKGETVLVG